VEYSSNPGFLGRLKARGQALIAKWGQDILLEKKRKTKRSQFIIKLALLDAIAVAMVVGIVSEMAAANECNR